MDGQNIIDVGYDVKKISVQQKVVVDYLNQMLELCDKIDARKIAPSIEGVAQLNSSIKNLNENITQITNTQTKYKTQLDEIQKAEAKEVDLYAKRQAAASDQVQSLAMETERLRQKNEEVKNSAKLNDAEIGSINQAKSAVSLLTAERNKLGNAEGENKDKIAALNAEINRNNEFIKNNSSALEKQKGNVGNYTASLNPLESLLAQIKSKMDQVTESGVANNSQIIKMQEQYNAVSAAATTAGSGFVSVTQEIRRTEQALQTLHAAGLSETEQFKQIQTELAKVRREYNEFAQGQKILESQAPTLTAMTAAAKGLSGAYALGAGASALFADGNEKVEKELNKLVAIMTFIQGLEEVHKFLMEKNTIITVLNSAATSVLTKAQQMLGLANVEQAATAEVATVAMEGEEIATVGATAATFGLVDAIVMTGIGALLIGLVYATVKLVGIVKDWVDADELAVKKNQELTTAMNEVLETIKNLDDAYLESSKRRIDSLQEFGDRQKAAGVTEIESLQIDKRVADAKMDMYEQLAKKHGLSIQQVKQGLAAEEKMYNDGLESLKKWRIEHAGDTEEEKKEYEASVKLAEDKIAGHKKAADDLRNIDEGYTISKQESAIKGIEITKKEADEEAQYILEHIKTTQELVKANNAAVLNNEHSTLEQRLAAIKSNYTSERKTAKAELSNILDDQTKSDKEKLSAQEKFNEEYGYKDANGKKVLGAKQIELNQSIFKENETARKRELTAITNTNKTNLENEINTKQKITESNEISVGVRLAALQSYSEDQKKVVQADADLQKKTKVLYDAEIIELDTATKIKLANITTDGELKRIDIIKSSFDKLKELDAEYIGEIQAMNIDNESKLAVQYSKDVQAFNKQLIDKTISLKQYDKERTDLDYQYALSLAANAIIQAKDQIKVYEAALKTGTSIEELEKQKGVLEEQIINDTEDSQKIAHVNELKRIKDELIAKKAAGTEIAKLNKLIADAEKEASDKGVAKDKKDSGERTKNLQNIIQEVQTYADKAASIIGGIINIQTTNQKNAIQAVENQQQENYSSEIDRINGSTLSEQDKADKLKILEAQRQAQKDKNARDTKAADLKKAQFDKDVAIMNIIISTAMAVVKALPNIPLAIISGVMGAAELAIAIATPLPKYAKGTDGIISPHFGIYGEAGAELISKPGQKPFIADKATIDYLPIGTKIKPLNNEDTKAIYQHAMYNKMVAYHSLNDIAERNKSNYLAIAIDRQSSKIDNQTNAIVKAITKSRPVIKVINTGSYDSFIHKNVR